MSGVHRCWNCSRLRCWYSSHSSSVSCRMGSQRRQPSSDLVPTRPPWLCCMRSRSSAGQDTQHASAHRACTRWHQPPTLPAGQSEGPRRAAVLGASLAAHVCCPLYLHPMQPCSPASWAQIARLEAEHLAQQESDTFASWLGLHAQLLGTILMRLMPSRSSAAVLADRTSPLAELKLNHAALRHRLLLDTSSFGAAAYTDCFGCCCSSAAGCCGLVTSTWVTIPCVNGAPGLPLQPCSTGSQQGYARPPLRQEAREHLRHPAGRVAQACAGAT